MIPERLKTLHSRLKNSLSEGSNSFKDEFLRHIAPTGIKLIEEEGIDHSLEQKFQERGVLEEFIERAALIISNPMTKEARKSNEEDSINRKFNELLEGLNEIDKIHNITEKNNIKQKYDRAVKALTVLKKSYLSEINPSSRPDMIDLLINLFLEYLPGESGLFRDKYIRKMLEPFGLAPQPDVVRVKEQRARKDEEWFLRRK